MKKEQIDTLDFSPSGKHVVTLTKTRCNVWSLDDSESPIIKLPLETEEYKRRKIIYKGCKFSKCGNFIFTGKIAPGGRSWIIKWKVDFNSKTLLLQKNIVAHRNNHHNVMNISPNGDFLATGTSDGGVAIFKTSNLKKILEVTAHDFFVTGLAFSGDSKTLVSISADYTYKPIQVKEQKGNTISFLIILAFVILVLAIMYTLWEKEIENYVDQSVVE